MSQNRHKIEIWRHENNGNPVQTTWLDRKDLHGFYNNKYCIMPRLHLHEKPPVRPSHVTQFPLNGMERGYRSRGSYGVYVTFTGSTWLLWGLRGNLSGSSTCNPITYSHVDPVTATRYPRPTPSCKNRLTWFLRDGFKWRSVRYILI